LNPAFKEIHKIRKIREFGQRPHSLSAVAYCHWPAEKSALTSAVSCPLRKAWILATADRNRLSGVKRQISESASLIFSVGTLRTEPELARGGGDEAGCGGSILRMS